MKYLNYIMTHKGAILPVAPWLKPMGLGAYTDDLVTESDNIRVPNISSLNKFYCELTGLFYIWKHTESEVVGISHYRRFLSLVPLKGGGRGWLSAPATEPFLEFLADQRQEDRALQLLESYDAILPMATYSNESVATDYIAAHGSQEWSKFVSLLDEKYGASNHALHFERRNYLCNMMIMRKPLFDRYCGELFEIIDETFRSCGVAEEVLNARYQPYRYPGYLAERFMSAFVNVNRLKVYEADVIALT